jgi:ABC-type Na+ efflux pump permease subunit
MLKKIWSLFTRDIKVNTREAIPLLIIMLPLVFAIGINLITPSINDTTVNIAMVKNENKEQSDYFDNFAHTEFFDNRQAVEERVMERDSMLGIVEEAGEYIILAQGNEPETVLEYTKLIKALYEKGSKLEDSRTEIVEFGKEIPQLKKLMVNTLLLLNAVLAGMIIALNILEEKTDHTVSAVNVTPVSRTAFILGKSLTGIVYALVLTIACIYITGFYEVDIIKVLLVVLATTVISMMIGFLQGVNSSDVMEAAGSVKLMFLPLAGSIAGYELVRGGWQVLFYWSPFYWAYKANDMILSQNGTWLELLICIMAILAISAVVYILMAPRIRKGLQ